MLQRITKSPFYGIMVDETTDRSTSIKLIIYIKYLGQDENGAWKTITDYLDLVTSSSQSALNIKVIFIDFTFI